MKLDMDSSFPMEIFIGRGVRTLDAGVLVDSSANKALFKLMLSSGESSENIWDP